MLGWLLGWQIAAGLDPSLLDHFSERGIAGLSVKKRGMRFRTNEQNEKKVQRDEFILLGLVDVWVEPKNNRGLRFTSEQYP